MNIELQQHLKIHQQVMITPQLQQAIKILQFSRLELEEFIDEQLINNPTLEDKKEGQNSIEEKVDDIKECDEDHNTVTQNLDQNALDSSINNNNQQQYTYQTDYNYSNESVNYEQFVSKKNNLQDHLLNQLGTYKLSLREQKIASLLIDAISDSGYLDLENKKIFENEDFSSHEIENIVLMIQSLDPLGVGARSLSECLSIQIYHHNLNNGIVEKIAKYHLEDVARNNYTYIAKSLGISLPEVKDNLKIILSLKSQPGTPFANEAIHYVVPDLYVTKTVGGWEVTLEKTKNENLQINTYYENLSKDSKKKKEKDYLKNKIKEAKWLIKSLHQREKTLIKVMAAILKMQSEFFNCGKEYLKPLILKDIAQETEFHESTISRVTNNKYVHTHQGVFDLRYFFNSKVLSSKGDEVASSVVKVLIKKILKEESHKKPLPDNKICEQLKEKGIKIARRTVAKYREQLGYLPSNKRHRYL